MARIGSTFAADQQFESFTRMPAFGVCTAPVRPPHNIRNCVRRTGGIVRVEAMGAVGAQAAERAEPERDESPLHRYGRRPSLASGFCAAGSRCQRAACPIKSIPLGARNG